MRDNTIKASVLMPVYNGEKFIKEAISSVLSQTFRDFELLVLDDGSTDDSTKIAESFQDERIRLVKLNHQGIAGALNYGLNLSNGEYIIRVDSDDISIPSRFEKILNYMDENKDIAICGSWAISINEKGETIGMMNYPPVENEEIKKYTLRHNPFIHPAIIMRKSILESVGGYRYLKHNEDYELWIRILSKYKGHNLTEPLLKYRIHPDQFTRKQNFRMRLSGIYIRILAMYRLGLNF